MLFVYLFLLPPVKSLSFITEQYHHTILTNCCAGERRRKSVRGCIVSPDLSVLNLVIVKKGEKDLPGLTDEEKPRMRGPKRASKVGWARALAVCIYE